MSFYYQFNTTNEVMSLIMTTIVFAPHSTYTLCQMIYQLLSSYPLNTSTLMLY